MYKTQFQSQQQLADYISENLNPARFGYRIVYEREPKMYKRSNPYYGRVIEQQIITNPRLGCDWKAIETALQQRYNPSWHPSVSDPSQFQHHPYPFDFYNRYFETLHSDPTQFYLKANTYENTDVKYIHYLDGHLLLGDQLRDVLSFFRPNPPHSDHRQDSLGIPPEHQLRFRDYKLSNIKQISLGNNLIYIDDEWFQRTVIDNPDPDL